MLWLRKIGERTIDNEFFHTNVALIFQITKLPFNVSRVLLIVASQILYLQNMIVHSGMYF